MLINLSNHPSFDWSTKQKGAATSTFGNIFDVNFPEIPSNSDTNYVLEIANRFKMICLDLINFSKDANNAVHIMGEMTFCFALVSLLQKENIICVASTTNRNSIEENGVKVSRFEFVRFREYPKI